MNVSSHKNMNTNFAHLTYAIVNANSSVKASRILEI